MQRNVAGQKVTVLAIDTATNLPKGSDASNITLYYNGDDGGVTIMSTNSGHPTEDDATNAPGCYSIALSQAETNYSKLNVIGKSSTSGIRVIPILNLQTVPAAFIVAGGASGGLVIAGSNAATTFSGLTTGALSCTTITASGAVAFQSTFAVTTSTALAALSCTTLTASGAVAFQSTFAITTSTSLAALSCTTLTASGAVALQSTLTVTGATSLAALSTSGTATINALTVTNATTLTGAVSLGSTLSTTGTVTFNAFTVTNNMLVSGTTTHTGAVSFGSTFATTGTTTFNALTVTNATTLSGAVSLGSTLSTTGTVTFNAFTVTNALTVSGATTLTGAVTASNVSNNIVGIDVAKLSGDATAADNAESFFDGTGYAGTNNVIPRVTLTDTLTTYTGNTVQTGDSFARIGATGSGLTSLAPSATALSTVQWTNTLATNLGTLAGHDPGATLASQTNITAGTITTVTTLSNLPSIPANWLTAAGIAASALNGKGDWLLSSSYTTPPTTAAIADKFLGRSIAGAADGGRTVTDALRFLRNRWTRTSTSLTVYAEDDSTTAWTAVLTVSSSANPVTESDPA